MRLGDHKSHSREQPRHIVPCLLTGHDEFVTPLHNIFDVLQSSSDRSLPSWGAPRILCRWPIRGVKGRMGGGLGVLLLFIREVSEATDQYNPDRERNNNAATH